MNYFGLMFTFMIPGVVIGGLLSMGAVSSAKAKRRAKEKRLENEARRAPAKRLYIHTLSADDGFCGKAA